MLSINRSIGEGLFFQALNKCLRMSAKENHLACFEKFTNSVIINMRGGLSEMKKICVYVVCLQYRNQDSPRLYCTQTAVTVFLNKPEIGKIRR